MDHEGAGVADVGEVRHELQAFDEPLAGRAAAVDPEREDRTRTVGQIPPGELVVGVVGQPGEGHPGHAFVGGEPLGDPLGVGDVLGHPLRQRLETLDQQEGVERAECGTDVTELLVAKRRAVGVLPEVSPPLESVVGRHGFGEPGKPARRTPVEAARLDHDPAERRAVPTDELGGRVHDDVRSVLDRSAEVGRGERRVHHQGEAVRVGDLGKRGEVGDRPRRVGDDLGVDGFGLGPDLGGDGLGITTGGVERDERGLDAETGHRRTEQCAGAAVEPGGGDDVIAGSGEGRDREERRGLPRGGRHGTDATFEARHALLERVQRRVRETAVDRAVLLEGEEVGGVGGVVEDKARRLIDRDRPGAGVGVGSTPGVQGTGAEAEGAVVVTHIVSQPRRPCGGFPRSASPAEASASRTVRPRS